jgi:hypothetical protein
MSLRIYGLWPIGVDPLRLENRITATVAAYSVEHARDLAVAAAHNQGIVESAMWRDPARACCMDLMDAGVTPKGFVELHFTPEWGISIGAQWGSPR